ncbi:MAG: N-acetylmuramoyl-L-alanine amidase [Saprospiraceae bacterium]|nr:N-acetylmuramoyl-L-alanine amidase [Saprospiraceae bacterium]
MKLNLFISTAILFLSGFTVAQNLTLEFLLEQKRTEFGNYKQEIDLSGYRFQDFLALSLKIEGDDLIHDGVRIKVQAMDSVYQLKQFHEELVEGLFVSELLYLPVSDAGILKFTFDYNSNINVQKLKGMIRFFSPGGIKIESKPFKKKSALADFSDCNCLQPDFVSRSIWGGSFGLNENIYKPPASYTDVTHLIVHHSAGTNTSSNWPGVVASIFDFHVNTNGWQDIGYNWLIDPNGIIYEGRGGGDNVRGAHMCGYNNNTMGVCILGTYTSVAPTQKSIEAIKNLFAWKSCKEEIDPVGSGQITSYPGFMKNISGHKDGCSPNYTECPGVVFYSLLDSIRYSTKNRIDNECSGSSVIQNDKMSEPVIVFPNPVSGILYYEITDNREIKELIVFNNFGEKVFRNDHGSDKSGKLDVSRLNNGMFYVKFKFSNGIYNRKFIKID